MFKRISIFFLSLLTLLLSALPENAPAAVCACCAEPGAYYLSTTKPEAHQLEMLSKMKFSPQAYIYMTAAGEDAIKGIENFSAAVSESAGAEPFGYGFLSSFLNKSWKMTFKDGKGRTGTLTLPMPTTMVDFDVDIHDGQQSGGGGPLLYKELRFKGNVTSGAGFLQKGILNPTTYFLVFQGRGNMCDNAEDFKHWRLEINGKKADYSFFGELNTPPAS